jgi:hypothetical protein
VFLGLLVICASANAEMEKVVTTTGCENQVCFHWWPILPTVRGWHQDRKRSLHYSFNAQAPDGKTFVDAETVIYANAPYKPRIPETKTLQKLIDGDQAAFRADGVVIREIQALETGDGQKLHTYAYSPTKSGNWEQVSYGEEGDFYLIFTISSRTQKGLANSIKDYKLFIHGYKAHFAN